MSLDPDELAIREAFERRRPASIPPELLARVAAVPGEVRPLRPMPVRLALGVAPWLAVVAAGLVVAFGPRFLASLPGPAAAPSDPAGPAWTPETTGGLAEIGIFGLPWVPYLVWVALVGGMAIVVHVRGGGTIQGRSDLGRAVRKFVSWNPRYSRRGKVLFFLLVFLPIVGNSFLDRWGPLAPGAEFGPGPDVSEVRSDGYWYDEARSEWTAPDPCLPTAPLCPGPRWVYRVNPGQPLSHIESFRNNSIVPVTVLGRESSPESIGPEGLGILREPSNLTADPLNVEPFHPVTVWPGQEVALVVVDSGWACANRAAPLRPIDNNSPGGRLLPALVYDVMGWRRTDSVHGHFEITIAGCDAPYNYPVDGSP